MVVKLGKSQHFCYNSASSRFYREILYGQVAQSVEQRIENPRVGSSILPLATIQFKTILQHPRVGVQHKIIFSEVILNMQCRLKRRWWGYLFLL